MDGHAKILLVDDKVENLNALEAILSSSVATTVRAQSADEALMALMQHDFAAMVLDIRMPGMDGIELAALVKQRKRTQHVPIVFLTAHMFNDHDALRGYGVGAVDYIIKPVNPEILRSKIGVFVELFRKSRQLEATNEALMRESAARQRVAAELLEMNRTLEARVGERTAELLAASRTARENAARLRAVVETAVDGIITIDEQGVVDSVNPAVERLFGYTAEEIVGHNVSHLMPQPYRGEHDGYLARFRQTGERRIIGIGREVAGRRKDGSEFPMELAVSEATLDDRRFFTGIVRDVTERRAAEELLRRAHSDLEARVRERTAELASKNEALRREAAERLRSERARTELLGRLVSAHEEERQRIAREMHDQFGGKLTELGLIIGLIKDASNKQINVGGRVEALEAVAQQLNRDVDDIVWRLRPSALDDLGLPAALANYVHDWSGHFEVSAQLHDAGFHDHRLPSEIETTLYRIAQEALTNVAKHAKAQHVEVILERRPGYVSLVVEDDGVGFDAEEAGTIGHHFGLQGMQERAALVGATLRVESASGQGTTVLVRIPTQIHREEVEHG